MFRRIWFVLGFLVFMTGMWDVSGIYARPFRPAQIPNGTVNNCANCHVNPAGSGPRNVFGQAVGSGFLSGGNVVWNKALAEMDSDGDGATNGQELGDPDGDGTPTAGAQVTNPGDPNSKPAPQQGGDGNGGVAPDVQPVGRIARINLDENLICLPGAVFLVPGAELEVLFPDGRRMGIVQAATTGAVGRGTRVAVEVERPEDGPPVAVSIRVLGPDERPQGREDLLVGEVETARVEEGLVQFRDRCFRLTEETEFLEDEGAFGAEDLRVGDGVRLTLGDPLPDDPFRTVEMVERLERAPESMRVVSVTLGDREIEEGAANPPVAAGLQTASITFSGPLDVEMTDEGPEFHNAEIQIVPDIFADGEPDLNISEDGLTLSAGLNLAANTTYQMMVVSHTQGNPESVLQEFYFGSSEAPAGFVSGFVSLPELLGEAQPEGRGFVLLLNRDPSALFPDDEDEDGESLGKLAGAARKVAARLLQDDGEEDDGEDGFDDGDGEDDGELEDALTAATVRLGVVDPEGGFEHRFVADGAYYLLATMPVRTPGGPLHLVGPFDADGDGSPDPVVVSGGGVEGLNVGLQVPAEEVRLEGIRISGVAPDRGELVFERPDGPPVPVDVSSALIRDPEGVRIDLADLQPGSRVNIWGEGALGRIVAYEVVVVQFEGPRPVRGTVLSIEPPSDRRPGLLTIIGGVFEFEEFGTIVQGTSGGRITIRDLREKMPVVVTFEEPGEEMGRPGKAVHVRVIAPGEPAPPPAPGQFVGQVGRIDFEGRRLLMALVFGVGGRTQVVDRNGEPISVQEIQPQAQVAVTPARSEFGVAVAARIKLLRGPDELPPERIVEAVFVVNGEEVLVRQAENVPTNVTARVRFDRPLTDRTLDAIEEAFVYSVDGDDVVLSPRVENGELALDLTLMDDMIYEAFLLLENGAEYFAQFTTGDALPKLEVVSVMPSDGTGGVGVQTTVSVAFNRPLDAEDGEVDADIFILPFPESGEVESEDLELSSDGMTVSVDVELAADRTYLVVVGDAGDREGFRLAGPVKSRFSTGTIGSATVSGNFVLPPSMNIQLAGRNAVGFVYLLPASVDIRNLEGEEPEKQAAGFDVTVSGAFEITHVPAGEYFVQGFVFVEDGPQGRELGLVGTYNDPDGHPMVLTVAENEAVENLEVRLVNELRVTSSKPGPGAFGVASGRRTVSIEFSEPLQVNRGQVALEAEIVPPIPNFVPRRDLRVSTLNPRRLEASVNLAADTDYQLIVFYARGVSGAELTDVVDIPFSTRAQFNPGIISGKISLSDGSAPGGSVILGDLENGRRAAEVKIRQDGTYEFKNIPAGEYGVFVNMKLSDGRTVRGLLDDDADGRPDPVALAAGQTVADINLSIPVPAAGQSGENAGVTLSFDFDPASGDGGQTTGQVTAGEKFSVAVYASGVSKLAAYEVVVNFDAQKLALQAVNENGSTEGENILEQNGGLGAFIGRVLEDSANLSAAILGPTEEVVVSGSGLLGVLEFVALESFSGETELTISQATIQGLDAVDEVSSGATGTVSAVTLTRALGLSANPTIIKADGTTSSTIAAQVLDLDGVLQSEDNSTVVTFSVTGGTGTLSSSTVTASEGVATTTLTTGAAGTVVVTASADGAKDVTVSVVAESTSGASDGPVGPLALDLNTDAGDQAQRQTSSTPGAGDQVVVDIVVTEGALDKIGVNVTLNYDENSLEFVSFDPADVFAGGLGIPVAKTGSVQLSVALLGASASKDAGSVGKATFKVKEGFSESTTLVLASGEFGTASGTEIVTIGLGGAVIQIGGSSGGGGGQPTPDFDGDGTVGFRDFVQFAQKYGSRQGDANYDAKFDLDGSGDVGFRDFVQFAQAYGKPI